MRLSEELARELRCPHCAGRVECSQDGVRCLTNACGLVFPLVNGCPILIDDDASVFTRSDFVERRRTTGQVQQVVSRPGIRDRAKQLVRALTPSTSYAVSDLSFQAALARIEALRPQQRLRILVLGAGDSQLSTGAAHDFVYTDVDLGPLTHVVCDAHQVPFRDASFDMVVCISVLEHVADPYRCAAEIHRLLRSNGYVYAVTPFMQQVHMGRYDFTRFTHLGHRRLFRWFEEHASGVANGPGMALSWSVERFLAGFARSQAWHARFRTLARFVAFPFKYFDCILARRPSAYDSASAFYFFGQKADTPLSDRELVGGYRGINA